MRHSLLASAAGNACLQSLCLPRRDNVQAVPHFATQGAVCVSRRRRSLPKAGLAHWQGQSQSL